MLSRLFSQSGTHWNSKRQNTSYNPKHVPGSKNTSSECKTRARIQKHFPQSKTRARIQIVLDPGTFFRFWEVFCPYEPRYLWSILPLVLLRDAIILVCTKSPDHCLTRYGLFSDFISNHSNSIACISAYWTDHCNENFWSSQLVSITQ